MSYSKPALTPSTHQFNRYVEEELRPLLSQFFSREQVSMMLDLIRYLEQQRYDFSASRAFQTRPIANAELAAKFSVTERSIRRWLRGLEKLGIIERQLRKNPRHGYKNLLNRIGFSSFCSWFKAKLAKTPDTPCPPNKKDIKYITISQQNSGDQPAPHEPFPQSGGIRYCKTWKGLAEKHLPAGRGRPCMDMIAQKFRENLKFYNLSVDHPSVRQRWIRFCERAKPV